MNSQASVAKPTIIDWLPRIDFIIDHPAEDVWPLVVHWERWIEDYRSEHVSGERDAVGEIKKISKLGEDGKVTGYFFNEIVRLIPKERLVYRVLPLEEPAFGLERIRGYEMFNVYEMNGKTLVTYQTVAQLETSLMSQEELNAAFGQQANANAVRMWSETYVPKLRKLLEK